MDPVDLSEEYRADLQALADVRTLDGFDHNWAMAKGPDDFYCLPHGTGTALAFDGGTLESARANAAAWVRGLK